MKTQRIAQFIVIICLLATIGIMFTTLNRPKKIESPVPAPPYTKYDIADGWCYTASRGKIYNIQPPEHPDCIRLKEERIGITPMPPSYNFYILEEDATSDADRIGGTVLGNCWDFTSGRTGIRYRGCMEESKYENQ